MSKTNKTKAGHTPGPWMVNGLDIECLNGVEICCIYKDGQEDRQANANQDLIASAPELLEALEYLVSTYPAVFTSTGIINAEKAIAKAKGGAE